jgi:chemotaxis protein MotB
MEHKQSEGGDQQPPIIIVRKTVHAVHHGGAWKVAYADFVTAMMSLFIVLWIVGQSREVKEYISNYFRDPGAFNHKSAGGVLRGQSSVLTKPLSLSEVRQQEEAREREKEREALLHRAQQQAFEQAAQKLRATIASFPEFDQMRDQIDIKITDDGLRIELLEKTESMFFDVGAATLKTKTKELLGLMAKTLGDLPNRIAVEGHTDSRPYPAQNGYTNWELSSDRANAARRYMQEAGLHTQQISEVRGYADTQLRNPQDPNDITNRRISIIVLYNSGEETAGVPASMAGGGVPGTLSPAAPPAGAPAARGSADHGGARAAGAGPVVPAFPVAPGNVRVPGGR